MFSFADTVFQSDCTICTPTSNERSFCCPTSPTAFAIVSVLDFGHSNRCVALVFKKYTLKYMWVKGYCNITSHHSEKKCICACVHMLDTHKVVNISSDSSTS